MQKKAGNSDAEELDAATKSGWNKTVDTKKLPTTIWFIDVQYSVKDLPNRHPYSISSKPKVDGNFVPHLRDEKTCQ